MIRRTTLLGCVLALALPIVGCDSDPDPVDAGGGTDSGTTTDSGSTMEEPPPPATVLDSAMMPVAADYSCLGTATEPAGGADTNVTFTAIDFQDGAAAVGGLTVHFFPDNTPTTGCTGSCVELTLDASGNGMAMAPADGWYAYRILAGQGSFTGADTDYVELLQVNEVTPADGTADFNALRGNSANTLASVAQVQRQPGTTIATGQAIDCNGAAVANVRLRVFDSSGLIEFGRANTGPKGFYFANGLPNAMLRQTNPDGLYGAGNIPAGETLRFEVWGVNGDGGEFEMLGCEMVDSVADGVSVVNVGPRRSDGPSGCSGG